MAHIGKPKKTTSSTFLKYDKENPTINSNIHQTTTCWPSLMANWSSGKHSVACYQAKWSQWKV